MCAAWGEPATFYETFIISGLDAAGKTSILYRLKLGEVFSTIPTIGINNKYIIQCHNECRRRPSFRTRQPTLQSISIIRPCT